MFFKFFAFIITAAFLTISSTGFSAWYDSQTDMKDTEKETTMFDMDKGEDALTVNIDIQPDNELNSVDLEKDKTLEVVLLGSDDFDVNNVDQSSLSLADAQGNGQVRAEDINQDGKNDLVIGFATDKLNLQEGSNELTLKGKTNDGRTFEGSDTVSIAAADFQPAGFDNVR